MKKNFIRSGRLIVLALFLIGNAACVSPFFKFNRRAESETKPQKRKYETKFSGADFDETISTGEYSGRVFRKLAGEDFVWLEETASKARANKERLNGGFWAIRSFYRGIRASDSSAAEYEKLFEKLNRWKNAYPDSITPRVAIYEAWANYAGEARGTGYADTVSESDRRLYSDRIEKAKAALLEVNDWREKCPYWYVGLLEIAKNEGWSFDDFDGLFREATAFEPDFYYFYQQKATYLLPRHSGSAGDFENFLSEIYTEKGAKLYYEVLSFFILHVGDMPYDHQKYSRETAKLGFVELRKNHGADKRRLNEFAKFLVLSGDMASADMIFDEIGENWDKEIWREKDRFDGYRQSAKQTVSFMKKQSSSN